MISNFWHPSYRLEKIRESIKEIEVEYEKDVEKLKETESKETCKYCDGSYLDDSGAGWIHSENCREGLLLGMLDKLLELIDLKELEYKTKGQI